MGIKRTDINLDAGMAYLGRTKNGKPRWFRLSPELVEMLKELPTKEGEPKVFWMFTANALTVAVSRAIKRAGLQDFRLHDLRYVLSLIMC